MRYRKVVLCLCIIIVITSFSCKKESSIVHNSHFGEPFLIKANETIFLTSDLLNRNESDSTLSVSFKKVLYDSRCPMASCYLCYGSMASIKVLLTTHQKDTAGISLTVLGCDTVNINEYCYQSKDTLGYRICLLKLDPYPGGNIQIEPSKYTAKLKISKL
jgi:hypothetical protein